MLRLIAARDLGPIPAVAAAAFVALAIFAWTERTVVVDPEGLSVPHWPWKLWQIAPLLMGFAGVWWVWLSTRRVPWVRSLALGAVALAVLANGYSDLFGDYRGDVWRTVNPIFIGASSVAAVGSCGGADALQGARARWCRRRWAFPGLRSTPTSSTMGSSGRYLTPSGCSPHSPGRPAPSQANVVTPEGGASSGDG